MARSLWSGSISFGLVNIPVRVVTAVQDKRVHFHMLSKDGSCRLRRKLYCPETGQEYDFKETTRGYEIAPSQYVIVNEDELEKLKPEGGRTIDIAEFVELSSIDPMYFDRTYYLLPAEGGAKAYTLLMDAMTEAGSVGIAQVVMRQKQYLVAIRVMDRALVMHTMHYAQEVQGIDAIADDLPQDVKVTDKEVKTARQLIDSMTDEFDPTRYEDTYRKQVEELIEAKAEGQGIQEVSEETEQAPAATIDLMEALKKSVQQKGKSKTKGGKKSA